MFSASLGVDILEGRGGSLSSETWTFLEDGAKFLGIVFWTIYICKNCHLAITQMLGQIHPGD